MPEIVIPDDVYDALELPELRERLDTEDDLTHLEIEAYEMILTAL